MAEPVVFIVDDDELVRRTLWRLFESVGISCRTFASPEEFLEVDSLVFRAWKTVENVAFGGIGLGQPLTDDSQHDVIGYEIARINDGLRLLTESGPGSNRLAQHVSRRYMRDVAVSHQLLCLRALAGAGRA